MVPSGLAHTRASTNTPTRLQGRRRLSPCSTPNLGCTLTSDRSQVDAATTTRCAEHTPEPAQHTHQAQVESCAQALHQHESGALVLPHVGRPAASETVSCYSGGNPPSVSAAGVVPPRPATARTHKHMQLPTRRPGHCARRAPAVPQAHNNRVHPTAGHLAVHAEPMHRASPTAAQLHTPSRNSSGQ